jgi:hypothetical protein
MPGPIWVKDLPSYSEGTLPLNPTKDVFAFGQHTQGLVKKDNLYAWVAGVTQFYWHAQFDLFGLKSALSTAIDACAGALDCYIRK